MTELWNQFVATFTVSNIKDWWNPEGYLKAVPSADWPFKWAYAALLVILLLGIIVLPFLKKIQPQIREKLIGFCWTNLIIGLVLGASRWQGIPLFGMDAWRLLQELLMLAWLILLAISHRKAAPKQQLDQAVSAYKARYLPKPKTR